MLVCKILYMVFFFFFFFFCVWLNLVMKCSR
jgi:hypothetical protein